MSSEINTILNKSGFLNCIEFNHYAPLSKLNSFFFGIDNFSKIINYTFLSHTKITKYHNNELCIDKSDIMFYLEHLSKALDLEHNINCIPYNYYKTFGINIPSHYMEIINSIDNFVDYLDNVNTHEAKTIKYIIKPANYINANFVDAFNFDPNNNIDMTELIINFNNNGTPLFIRMSKNILKINFLRIGNNTKQEYETLYLQLREKLLMDSPRDFLINNIERVCGSGEFAILMVDSYTKKQEYVISIDSLASIILWKNLDTMEKFRKYFCIRYPNLIQNDYINFEGINKFLLNISESDVVNFEVKEMINEMYYNSMHELIYSFEKLYENK